MLNTDKRRVPVNATNFLFGKGCHMMHGYYFEKPSAAGRIEQLLSTPFAMPVHSNAVS